uniref:Ig-like domain-containing protein n=1 Tax=Naja naja TaxID=35670 RepID=A0A8C7E5Z2_NAJNA
MPENESACWIRLLPCKKKNLFLSLAAILAILCKGTRTQPGWWYTITVSPSVFVQRGFTVYIPCQFTYDQRDLERTGNVLAYWIKEQPRRFSCSPSHEQSCLPVATNDQTKGVELSAKDRFYLVGDPWKGNCSLVIRDARIEDEGRYYLRIEGRLKFSFVRGNGYASPYVYVIEPPQKINITVDITDSRQFGSSESQRKEGVNSVKVKEGNTVSLICTADGRPVPKLSWMKENQKVGESTGYLQLHKIGPEDAGKYQCLANNQHGSLKTMVEVIVQYHPRMLVFNTSQTHRKGSILTQGWSKELASDSELTAQEGDSLEVFCKADSNPPATTSWVKRDSPLQKPVDNQLRLTNLTLADEGVYVCKATNMLGDVQGTFQLSVTYAPKLSRSPQKNTTCSYHDNGFLCVCTLHAKPPPQIEWEVDGERVTEESRRRGNLTVQKNEVTSTLNWMGSLDRAHNIICMGSNSYGIQSIQFLLDAKRHPTSESSTGIFTAGICGIFLGAGILMLCLFLIRVFKQKKALFEASHLEGTPSERELQEKSNNSSHIYSNIPPMGPRLYPVDKSKPAQERKPKVPQVSAAPAPRRSEPPELQYAAIDFKPKSKGVPALSDDDVEYSSIQRK